MLRNGNSIVPLRVKRFPHILVFQAEVSIVEVIHPAQVGFREERLARRNLPCSINDGLRYIVLWRRKRMARGDAGRER